MFLAFLLSFHLSETPQQGRKNESIKEKTFEIKENGYFVILNNQDFDVSDSDSGVVYHNTKITIKSKTGGEKTIYYYYGEFDKASLVDFVIGFNPVPLEPIDFQDKQLEESEFYYTVFLPTASTHYNLETHGNMTYHKDNDQSITDQNSSFEFDLNENQFSYIKRPAAGPATATFYINVKLDSKPKYDSCNGLYSSDESLWLSSAKIFTSSSSLDYGIYDLLFSKSTTEYEFNLSKDSVFIIIKQKNNNGISGTVTYLENSKETKINITEKTSTIMCNVETNITIKSTYYPVVRVVYLNLKNVPYSAGCATLSTPIDFTINDQNNYTTFAVYVANPTTQQFQVLSEHYSIKIYDSSSSDVTKNEYSYDSSAIVYFEISKLQSGISGQIDFGQSHTGNLDNTVFYNNTGEYINAGIYSKKPIGKSKLPIIIISVIATIIVVAVIVFVVYFRFFRFRDSV